MKTENLLGIIAALEGFKSGFTFRFLISLIFFGFNIFALSERHFVRIRLKKSYDQVDDVFLSGITKGTLVYKSATTYLTDQ